MFKSIAKRILVQIFDLKEKKESPLLILPDERKPFTAMVIAIGGEVDEGLELGDIVYLPYETGVEIEVHGHKLLSITENQILAAWKDK